MSEWWRVYPTYRDQLQRAKELQDKVMPTDDDVRELTEIYGHLSVVYGSAQVVSVLIDRQELAGA